MNSCQHFFLCSFVKVPVDLKPKRISPKLCADANRSASNALCSKSILFLANIHDVLTKRWRDHRPLFAALQPLRAGLRASWGRNVARVSVVAHRLEFGIWVIRPDVGRLHPRVAILAVCNGVARQISHPRHFPHAAARVLDEPVPRMQLTDKTC